MITIDCKEVGGFALLNERVNMFVMFNQKQTWCTISEFENDMKNDRWTWIKPSFTFEEIEKLYYEKYPKK